MAHQMSRICQEEDTITVRVVNNSGQGPTRENEGRHVTTTNLHLERFAIMSAETMLQVGLQETSATEGFV